MLFEDFLLLHSEKASKLSVFTEDFGAGACDKPVTDFEISRIEKEYDISFPENYKKFCKEFGGGYFGYTIVFSLDRTGDWFIFDKLKELTSYGYTLESKFLPFSDDQTGGLYCFVREGKIIKDAILYIDEMNDTEPSGYSDLIDFVSKTAYK